MRRISKTKENNRGVIPLFTDAKLLQNDDNSPGHAQHDGDQKQIKKRSDGIDNYHLIIDAAFGQFGLRKTTVADIAGEVHMSAAKSIASSRRDPK